MFKSVPARFDFPGMEREVLEFWRERDIFHKSLRGRQGCPTFVFYEGPPTANGRPHPGHALTRVIKDVFPRYKTMCGYYVPRKAGWDTHGLPVEIEVEKDLEISGKDQIEAYGVEPFVRKCMESVFVYTEEWERLTERIGFWIDLDEAYVTYRTSYIESVWWALAQIHKRGLLYLGHKSVPYCPRCGTALSSHEVGQGYQTIDDVSVYVGFRSKADPKTLLMAWTTTPWTLPSNAALAVDESFDYAHVKVGDETLIIADALVEKVLGNIPFEKTRRVKGADLLGMEYEPLYAFARFPERAHYVVKADFVSLDSGTGIVHVAPGFGADDYRVGVEYGLPVIQLVDPAGHMTGETGPFAGKFVKDADPLVIDDLKRRGLLLRREQYRHDYPFCWRCDAPLIYYARRSWFIRTTQEIDRIIANNQRINWLPGHIRDGRFGNFLETNVDWALSRERYWGTPLPIWICENAACGHQVAIASRQEILDRNPEAFERFAALRAQDPSLSEHLELHKPYIDDVRFACEKCGGSMRRTPEVIDCWFDSGSMPFAQWGYPYRGEAAFRAAFPADFISEAIDQTRGWFYSLLAVSTLVFPDQPYPHPFKNCIVLGHVGDEEGRKMSKSLGNVVEPNTILDEEGADALRWYFCAAQPPYTSTRFAERFVAEQQRDFLVRLYNVYSFFTIYANLDGFDPAAGNAGATDTTPQGLAAGAHYRRAADRSLLDRWIMSELNLVTGRLRDLLDGYDIYNAARALADFVDGLSNWYVRRSRDRFWKSQKDQDKFDAHWTLYECLVTLSKLAAPFVPFFTESIYRNLVGGRFAGAPESVHLCDYPVCDGALVDATLSDEMGLVRQIVALGRSARVAERIKVRQPLSEVELILAEPGKAELLRRFVDLIGEELNVKRVQFATEADRFVDYHVKPNFKAIGPKHGKLVPAIKKALTGADASALRVELVQAGRIELPVQGGTVALGPDEIEVALTAKPGYAAAQGRDAVVVLKTDIDDALRAEGVARELVHHVQTARKEMDLAYEARIQLGLVGGPAIGDVVAAHRDYIAVETLARCVETAPIEAGFSKTVQLDSETVTLYLKEVKG